MVDLDLQIKSIQDKLQQLLRQQSALQKENQKLKRDLEKAVADKDEKEQSLQAIHQQVDALKLGSGNNLLNDTEKNALSKRIDGYLKEIDKCLALLNT
jgi:regulator of replication initiation timing